MATKHKSKWRRVQGATLMELLIVVAVIAMLTMIAYPNFVRTKYESRRTDAQGAVIAVDSMVRRYLTETNQPNFTSGDFSLSQFANYSSSSSTPVYSPQGYYILTIIPDSSGFTVTATATVRNSTATCFANPTSQQCADNLCQEISLYHGTKQSTDSSGDVYNASTTQCW